MRVSWIVQVPRRQMQAYKELSQCLMINSGSTTQSERPAAIAHVTGANAAKVSSRANNTWKLGNTAELIDGVLTAFTTS